MSSGLPATFSLSQMKLGGGTPASSLAVAKGQVGSEVLPVKHRSTQKNRRKIMTQSQMEHVREI